MAVKYEVLRNQGHPWDERLGWDQMHVSADTHDELQSFIEKARAKFWAVWIGGGRNDSRAYLYKPSGATGPWGDSEK